MFNNSQLSTQERLNLAVSVIERQRLKIEELENEKNELQSQLNQTNKGILDIINSNVELKEQNQALLVENNAIINELSQYEEKTESLELAASIGMHFTEAVNKINELNNLNKK